MTVSKHVFSPPNPADPAQVCPFGQKEEKGRTNISFQLEMAPPLRDEIIVDRATQNSARNRFDTLNKESGELDAQSRQLGEAYETMIRIQTRYYIHFFLYCLTISAFISQMDMYYELVH